MVQVEAERAMSDLREKVEGLAVQYDGVPYLKLEQDERRTLALAVAALVAEECARECNPDNYAIGGTPWTDGMRDGISQCRANIRRLAETLK